jgi:hypothetical protein
MIHHIRGGGMKYFQNIYVKIYVIVHHFKKSSKLYQFIIVLISFNNIGWNRAATVFKKKP